MEALCRMVNIYIYIYVCVCVCVYTYVLSVLVRLITQIHLVPRLRMSGVVAPFLYGFMACIGTKHLFNVSLNCRKLL